MPITVPGMAKLIIARNSNADRPAKRWRFSSQAVSRPSAAVTGMATSESSIVVRKDGQPEPLRNQPPTPRSTPKAILKYSKVGVVVTPEAHDEAAGEDDAVHRDRQRQPRQHGCVT